MGDVKSDEVIVGEVKNNFSLLAVNKNEYLVTNISKKEPDSSNDNILTIGIHEPMKNLPDSEELLNSDFVWSR